MNLKQLCETVDGLRARGVHPLTEVLIREDSVGSVIEIGAVQLDRGHIVVTPRYDDAQRPGDVEDDE